MVAPSPLLRRFFVPPPRRGVVLPDGRFFARVVNVDATATAAAGQEQLALALETLAPFPAAQLFHGQAWRAGSGRALVYAAYRKRFTNDETAAWAEAEVVVPALAVVAQVPAEAGTLRLVPGAEAWTALYWGEKGELPTAVRVAVFAAEAAETQGVAARQALVDAWPEARVVEEWALPAFASDAPERELAWIAGDQRVTARPEQAEALDIRDKDELATRRRLRQRDEWLWRGFLLTVALVLLSGILELALVAGRMLVKRGDLAIAARAPEVSLVMKADTLATQIERLTSERLLPMEMLGLVSAQRPGKTQLLSVRMEGVNSLQATARTSAVTDIDAFRAALSQRPEFEQVEVQDTLIRDGVATFTLVVKFKPKAFRVEGGPS